MFGNSNIVGILQGYVPCCSVLFICFTKALVKLS